MLYFTSVQSDMSRPAFSTCCFAQWTCWLALHAGNALHGVMCSNASVTRSAGFSQQAPAGTSSQAMISCLRCHLRRMSSEPRSSLFPVSGHNATLKPFSDAPLSDRLHSVKLCHTPQIGCIVRQAGSSGMAMLLLVALLQPASGHARQKGASDALNHLALCR